jgi:RNA polymerase sigma factor (sigma-70 family)
MPATSSPPVVDNGVVEYDEFGLPVTSPAEPARPVASDVAEQCVNDLMDDWQRQGGLSLTDVHRSADKLGLNATQIAQVISRLESVGAYDPQAGANRAGEVEALDDVSYSGRDSVRAYLQEIGRYRLLRAEDEVALGRRIRAGQSAGEELENLSVDVDARYLRRLVADGRAAHSELVCANLRLAVNMARHPRYRGSSVDLLDRIQLGNLGLMRATDKYDYTLGFKFSTYATWWIRQSMERGLADEGRLIRLPVHVVEKLNRLKRVRTELSETLNRPATVREVADHLGEDPGTVAAVLDSDRTVASLDAGLGEDGDEFTLLDVVDDAVLDVDPVDEVVASITAAELHSILADMLSEREYKVVNERFGLDGGDTRTLDEIGKDLGVTRERVRQIQSKVLTRLRGKPGKAIRDLLSVEGQAPALTATPEPSGAEAVSDETPEPESGSEAEVSNGSNGAIADPCGYPTAVSYDEIETGAAS